MRCIRNLYLYQEPSFVKMDQNPLNIVSKTLLPLTFSRERLSCQNSVVDTTWTTKSQTKTCAVRTTVTIRLPVVVVLSFRRRCLSSLFTHLAPTSGRYGTGRALHRRFPSCRDRSSNQSSRCSFYMYGSLKAVGCEMN